jgi:phospholipase/lecithinase/hemolysin
MNKFLSCVVAVLLVSTPVVHAGSGIGDIVVFGDSMSDPGNVFVVTGTQSVRPFNSSGIPDAPYARGGHHSVMAEHGSNSCLPSSN